MEDTFENNEGMFENYKEYEDLNLPDIDDYTETFPESPEAPETKKTTETKQKAKTTKKSADNDSTNESSSVQELSKQTYKTVEVVGTADKTTDSAPSRFESFIDGSASTLIALLIILLIIPYVLFVSACLNISRISKQLKDTNETLLALTNDRRWRDTQDGKQLRPKDEDK